MAQATPSVNDTLKDIGNTLYNSALIAVAIAGSRYLTTKCVGLKDRPIDFKPKDIGMLTLDIGIGTMVVKKLHDAGVPNKIFT